MLRNTSAPSGSLMLVALIADMAGLFPSRRRTRAVLAGLVGGIALVVAQEDLLQAGLVRCQVNRPLLGSHTQPVSVVGRHTEAFHAAGRAWLHIGDGGQQLEGVAQWWRIEADLDDMMLEIFERCHLAYRDEPALTDDAHAVTG